MTNKSYQDLIVWQKSIDLVEIIYRMTKAFPKHETYGLISQMQRASVSVASNIAEGQGRNSNSAFVRFLSYSQGSLKELETQLLISSRLNYIDQNQLDVILKHCDEIGKMITGLQKKISN
jgi:four helix bundle protein